MNNKNKKQNGILVIVIIFFIFATCINNVFFVMPTNAMQTTPYTLSYSARLTDKSKKTITTPHQIRFSIWSDSDVDSTDFLLNGEIDPLANGFTGWQETHLVTPDISGVFIVQLGSINKLPNFNSNVHTFLQVDIKENGKSDISYETLDPDGNINNINDRHPINSVAFAINSDTVDNKDIGYEAGEIPYLDFSALLPISTIPEGTNQNRFIIGADDNSTSPTKISLQFGENLARVLEYNIDEGFFNFNDNLRVSGDFSASGNIDFSLASEFHLREVSDKSVAKCTNINEMVLDTTEKQLYVCIGSGDPGIWSPLTGEVGSYNQKIVYEPEYKNAVYVQDGSNNKGSLSIGYESDVGGQTYYIWNSNQQTIQNIDLVIRSQIPEGFVGWQETPINFKYKTLNNNTSNNKIDITIEDTSGNEIQLNSASNLVSENWTTSNISFSGSQVWEKGESITIKIKLSADQFGSANAGKLSLNYIGR